MLLCYLLWLQSGTTWTTITFIGNSNGNYKNCIINDKRWHLGQLWLMNLSLLIVSLLFITIIVLCRDKLFILVLSPWLLYLNYKDIDIIGGFKWVVCKRFANERLLTNQREIIIALDKPQKRLRYPNSRIKNMNKFKWRNKNNGY